MQYTVWKIEGDKASEITAPDSKANAEAALVTLNAGLLALYEECPWRDSYADPIRYEALPLGGSPFDA